MTPADAIVTTGYAVFPHACEPSAVATLVEAIEGIVREVEPPALYAQDTVHVRDDVSITPTGLAISRLLGRRPDLAPLVLAPVVIDAIREVLGPDMRLELAGAVVSDASRPFFRWHTHIDGEEEGSRYRGGTWPVVDAVKRVLTLLYLCDLDDESGPLLVLPREVGDPTAPPASIDDPRWPGQVEVRARAGTLVALEQCTWHAAWSKKGAGHRIFVGCYFAAADAPVPAWADASLGSDILSSRR